MGSIRRKRLRLVSQLVREKLFSRRQFLKGAGGGATAVMLAGCGLADNAAVPRGGLAAGAGLATGSAPTTTPDDAAGGPAMPSSTAPAGATASPATGSTPVPSSGSGAGAGAGQTPTPTSGSGQTPEPTPAPSPPPEPTSEPQPQPQPDPEPQPQASTYAPATASFGHGVASGDPLTDRVVLWTRVTPDNAILTSGRAVRVDCVVSRVSSLTDPVHRSSAATDGTRDYTVKLDPTGLQSYTTYYYQFSVTLADGSVVRSAIGRTKTAPRAGDTDRLRLIACCCQDYIYGFFNPYRAMAVKPDCDAILFLGDYIYEQGGTAFVPGRDHQPKGEIITLADYRTRYAQYRTDEDLQAAHRQFPFICVWDDHETADNSWTGGSDRHDPTTDGPWDVRKAVAIRAYFEWLPIRNNASTAYDSANHEGYLATGNGKIVRKLAYGDLADIILLDTRLLARAEPTDTVTVTPEHTILGDEQRAWLFRQLATSTAKWKIIAQQVQFAPFKVVPLPESQGGTYFLADSWDGYRYDRNLVMQFLNMTKLNNVVFLSGDSHSVTAWDLPIEPNDSASYDRTTGAGSLAVEYGTGAIANLGTLNDGVQAINPHLKYANNTNGYLLLDITAARVQGEYWFTVSPQVHQRAETFQRGFVNADKANRLTLTLTATSGRTNVAGLAP